MKPADSAGADEATLFREKALAELTLADRHLVEGTVVAWSGDPMAAVALVKGVPGPAESAGGEVLSGPDGEAVAKALAALGYSGTVFATLTRADAAKAPAGGPARLREQIEAVEPGLVIALDAAAAEDLAFAIGCAPLTPGRPVRVWGRTLLSLSGMEASLGDEHLKAVVWAQFRSLLRDPEEGAQGASGRSGDQLLF
jgi:uracil-DNA glycosylase